ncbi:MAG: RnfABCDGE type electron transport complex subunit D [Eubacterium sp.]|nr:RnfABCDGE type electron transport complex subunit D [Eubacterium sp.]
MTNDELLKKIDDAPFLMTTEAARKKLRKPRSIYGDQILFMLAVTVMAFCRYGVRSLMVCAVSVVCCILTDMIGCFLSKKEYGIRDWSTVAYGLALSLMLPASVPYYVVALGSVLAITVKHIFGGKDNYIFNPAAVSIAFLIMCYPQQVLLYPSSPAGLELFDTSGAVLANGIESYFIKTGAMPALSPLEILMGNFSGPMGTTHILILAVSAICLICRRSISLSATVGGIGVMAGMTYLINPSGEEVVFLFISGFTLFGFIFLANDPQTLPLTGGGRLLYGVLLGLITTIFRQTAQIEGVFVFSLLVVNALSLYLDRLWFNIITGIKRLAVYLKENLSSYERISKSVKQGKTPELTDTQEIIIEPVNYNMPAIDSRVTKVKRKKVFSLKDAAEFFRKRFAGKERQASDSGTADTPAEEAEREEDI